MYSKVKMAVVESYIGENFLSYTAFCKQCGISMSSFSKIRKGERVSLVLIIKIAQTINVELSDLME